MSRSHQAVGVLIVFLFGLWGCSRAPTAEADATAEKLRIVESKMARLEEDFRAVASARDQLGRKLVAAEEARTALQEQVVRLTRDVKEKDDLIQTRTAERDQSTGQLKTLKDGLKDLLTRMEDSPKADGPPTVPVIPASNHRPESPTK